MTKKIYKPYEFYAPVKVQQGVEALPPWTANDKGRILKVKGGKFYFGGETGWVTYGDLTELNDHLANKKNPHAVTKEQVGLGTLPNLKSDAVDSDNSNSLATSKAVKAAYDLANHHHPYTDGAVHPVVGSPQTAMGIWTITGLIVGKPLIVGMGNTGIQSTVGVSCHFKILSGTHIGRVTASHRWATVSISGYSDETTLPTMTLVPTAQAVSIEIVGITTGCGLYAYQ